MCLGMNPHRGGRRARASTLSNRNLRRGAVRASGALHLVSPQMAAAAAIEGRFVDIREWEG